MHKVTSPPRSWRGPHCGCGQYFASFHSTALHSWVLGRGRQGGCGHEFHFILLHSTPLHFTFGFWQGACKEGPGTNPTPIPSLNLCFFFLSLLIFPLFFCVCVCWEWFCKVGCGHCMGRRTCRGCERPWRAASCLSARLASFHCTNTWPSLRTRGRTSSSRQRWRNSSTGIAPLAASLTAVAVPLTSHLSNSTVPWTHLGSHIGMRTHGRTWANTVTHGGHAWDLTRSLMRGLLNPVIQ